jgi:hypothetical protein
VARATIEAIPTLQVARILAQWPIGDGSPRTCTIQVRRSAKRLFLKILWANSGRPSGLICFSLQPGTQSQIQRVSLAHSLMPNGGLQTFAICPGCGKRRRALYVTEWLLCRECLGLTYRSCQESHSGEAAAALIGLSLGYSGRDVLRVLKEENQQEARAIRRARWNEHRRHLRLRSAERLDLAEPWAFSARPAKSPHRASQSETRGTLGDPGPVTCEEGLMPKAGCVLPRLLQLARPTSNRTSPKQKFKVN